MSSKKKQRFFVKRIEESSSETPLEKPVEVLPQNSRPIPADIGTHFLMFFCYFCLIFVFVVAGRGMISSSQRIEPLVLELTQKPFSVSTHLDYLNYLVSSYRLNEAVEESRVIANLNQVFGFSQNDSGRFESLKRLISDKQSKFTNVVDSYLYWQKITNERPYYRDGLYSFSQFSFMLFDDFSTKKSLTKAVGVDPQFEIGKRVLFHFDK